MFSFSSDNRYMKKCSVTNPQGNANQSHSELSPHSYWEWLLSERLEIVSVGGEKGARMSLVPPKPDQHEVVIRIHSHHSDRSKKKADCVFLSLKKKKSK